jgi:hypothetical protein
MSMYASSQTMHSKLINETKVIHFRNSSAINGISYNTKQSRSHLAPCSMPYADLIIPSFSILYRIVPSEICKARAALD